MKKLILASFVTLTVFSTYSYADTNEKMNKSKYCRTTENGADPICMGPEMMKMREQMMKMTKEKAMENRSMYCRNGTGGDDPICDPKMMGDTTGY